MEVYYTQQAARIQELEETVHKLNHLVAIFHEQQNGRDNSEVIMGQLRDNRKLWNDFSELPEKVSNEGPGGR